MTWRLRCLLLVIMYLSLSVNLAHANARLMFVVPIGLDPGCVDGPNGESVQSWEVQPGKSYMLTIVEATDCDNVAGNGSIGVRINSSSVGNTDRVATPTGVPGEYVFTFDVPANAQCTMPIFYCTTPGLSNTGLKVWRRANDEFQAHLRMASFAPDCASFTAINGGDCLAVPTRSLTWGQVKKIYR